MKNEYVSELIMMSQMNCMDCSNEGSGDPDCNCDGVDGNQNIQETLNRLHLFYFIETCLKSFQLFVN